MKEPLLNYYHTIKDLKWIQIRNQLKVRFFKRSFKLVNYHGSTSFLDLSSPVVSSHSFLGNGRFHFLNKTQVFPDDIDWGFSEFGKLWTYNLNYFDFLNQEAISSDEGLLLIQSFMEATRKDNDPYPTSLRIINWSKFISKHKIINKDISNSIYSQTLHLSKNVEFHLMGNHLLENGFALLFSAFLFDNGQFFKQASEILIPQLKEQVLDDGGHFELSPMYHCIILNRVLEAIDCIENNKRSFSASILLGLLKEKSAKMISWLNQMTYADGSFPNVNDSTRGIAPSPSSLLDYAEILQIEKSDSKLKESGYRKVNTPSFELYFDVGEIGPAYIPGHAHSDTLSLNMHLFGKPFLVDRGISTYEKNATRLEERRTRSHNTVEVDGKEQSEVWSGFRVGRKAKIINLIEEKNRFSATHDGYSVIGAEHTRNIEWMNKSILVIDHVSNKYRCVAAFHFHPDIHIRKDGAAIRTDESIINFENADKIEVLEYNYSEGFNQVRKAFKVCVSFSQELTTKMTFNESSVFN